MSASASGYLRHFIACNRHDPSRYVPFVIAGTRYGFVEKSLAGLLRQKISGFIGDKNTLALDPALTDFKARSAVLQEAVLWLMQQFKQEIRDEMYPLITQIDEDPIAQIDRAAASHFGIRGWGVHVNGYVRRAEGVFLWVGQRALDKWVDAGKFDEMIAGGHSIGFSIEETLQKEAEEEAGLGVEITRNARFVREISYRMAHNKGLRDHTLMVYDLEMPEGVVPRNTDGEVAAFHLMPLREVAALVRDTDRVKFNCNLVMTDFLFRHGALDTQDLEYGLLARLLGTGV